MTRTGRQGGFTLVELSGAACLAVVALVATAASVTSGAQMARTTKATRAAVRVSSALLEDVRATPFGLLDATWNETTHAVAEFGGGDSSGTARVTVVPLETGSLRWRLYEVRVTATLTGTSGADLSDYVTYVSDRYAGGPLSGSVTTIAGDKTR
jgi:hypothetical protein